MEGLFDDWLYLLFYLKSLEVSIGAHSRSTGHFLSREFIEIRNGIFLLLLFTSTYNYLLL
jgi:hypothetical protein